MKRDAKGNRKNKNSMHGGDNCKRRLKNGDQNHQDEENGRLDSTEERKNYLFGINYQKRLPTRTYSPAELTKQTKDIYILEFHCQVFVKTTERLLHCT